MDRKVSIVIPVYNGANYVEQAIESALAQTYNNLEILLVNDGSKDNTEEIIKKYDGKVKYLKKENGGVSSALNLAIENMTGDYFSWLSHDDLYYPNKIEEEMKIASKDSIIMSDFDLIDENSKVFSKAILPHEIIEKNNELALLNGHINGITLLIPKEAFEKCGKFDETLRCTQDYDLWFTMMTNGYKFKHINKILASSRQHSFQDTNTNPKVITEGNALWINMIKNLPIEIKERLYSTEYSFYKNMSTYLKLTPFKEALEYSSKKAKELRKNIDVKNTLVSIIMPVTNETKKELFNSAKSVFYQTHKKTELIILNKSIYEKEELLDLFNEKNVKYSENINDAIKKSSGQFVSFISKGDEYLKNKIQIQLEELVLCDGTLSNTSYILNDKEEKIIEEKKINSEIIREVICNGTLLLSELMIKKNILKSSIKDMTGCEICLYLNLLLENNIINIDEALIKTSKINNTSHEVFKNVLAFVLNNEDLSKYDYEIALLSQKYSSLVLGTNYEKTNVSVLNKIKRPFILIKKGFESLKRNGVKSTTYKIKRYLCKEKK